MIDFNVEDFYLIFQEVENGFVVKAPGSNKTFVFSSIDALSSFLKENYTEHGLVEGGKIHKLKLALVGGQDEKKEEPKEQATAEKA